MLRYNYAGGNTIMTTLSISVPPELEHYILEKISSGVYHSPSEVMQEGLRLLSEQDEL